MNPIQSEKPGIFSLETFIVTAVILAFLAFVCVPQSFWVNLSMSWFK